MTATLVSIAIGVLVVGVEGWSASVCSSGRGTRCNAVFVARRARVPAAQAPAQKEQTSKSKPQQRQPRGRGPSIRGTGERLRGQGHPWQKGLLALFVAAACLVPGRALAEDVDVFFGQGCFWHVQHDLAKQEMKILGRTTSNITAVAGYAGGRDAGPQGAVCYHNSKGAPDYAKLGHAEVVRVRIPEQSVAAFARSYFDDVSSTPAGRRDSLLSWGGEYRSALGLPGGVDSPVYAAVQAANAGRLVLEAGNGNDSDTLWAKKVYVYDSSKFPFYQAEMYHQFHDDLLQLYNGNYHALKDKFRKAGKLHAVSCPDDPSDTTPTSG